VSPGFSVPVVRREDGSENEGHVVQCMKWGLIPSFTKKTEKPDHYKMVKFTHFMFHSLSVSFFFGINRHYL
jgi:putative SOS response-associated peptidase YedK